MSVKTIHIISRLWRGAVVLAVVFSLLASRSSSPAQAQSGLVLSTAYHFPANSYPTGLAYGPKAALWLTLGKANAVAQLNLPSQLNQVDLMAGAYPFDIAVGEQDTVWFTEQKGNKIARLDANGSLVEFALEEENRYPSQIIAGQDGGLWFTEYQGNRIGRIDVEGSILEYELPHLDSRPLGIAVAADGAIWFTEWGGQSLGRIDANGSLTEYPLENKSWRPTEIVFGPDGFLWMIFDIGQTLVRIDPADGAMTTYTLSTGNASFLDLAFGPDDRLWLLGTHTVARLKNPIGSLPEVETVSLSLSVYDSQGRSQIIAGPGAEMFLTNGRNQDISRVNVPDAVGRDLQIFILPYPSVMLADGTMELDLEVDNWSSSAANHVEINIPLPDGVHFVEAPVPGLTCAEAGGHALCQLDSLAGGGRVIIPVFFSVARINAEQETRFIEFSVTSDAVDHNPGNNRAFRTLTIQRTIDYANDFGQGADSHWSHDLVNSPDGQLKYLGGFDNQDVTLTFTNLPHHDRAYLCFDLYILGGWDGEQLVDPADVGEPPQVIGPDLWANYIDDVKLWVTSFSNDPRLAQSFPHAYNEGVFPAQSNSEAVGDFDRDTSFIDSRYHFCSEQVHIGPELKYTFYGANLDGANGEQWALDNVTVNLYYHDVINWLYMPQIQR